MIELNETHDPTLESWLSSANAAEADFPIQNLPFGVFSDAGSSSQDPGRIGVAIGDRVVDLAALRDAGLLRGEADVAASFAADPTLNRLMDAEPTVLSALRLALSRLLRRDSETRAQVEACLVPLSAVRSRLPARIGNFTDFYTSIQHATNAGQLMRPGGSLVSNFRHIPIAYHGRASSIVVDGTDCRRPKGQIRAHADGEPIYTATAKLDFEAEVGFLIRQGNRLGEPIPLAQAPSHVFGLCLVNDWSARDIQSWEAQPLGPFLGKSFMTTVSPWVVTLEALAPFRRAAAARGPDAPALLPHLDDTADRRFGGLGLQLSVTLRTAGDGARTSVERRIAELDFSTQYWTIFQMLAHHTSNGCNLVTGDLLASGTVSSGVAPHSAGCLFEQSRNGTEPLRMNDTVHRSFLEDGDELQIEARCSSQGARSIGFGTCRGRIAPAR